MSYRGFFWNGWGGQKRGYPLNIGLKNAESLLTVVLESFTAFDFDCTALADRWLGYNELNVNFLKTILDADVLKTAVTAVVNYHETILDAAVGTVVTGNSEIP